MKPSSMLAAVLMLVAATLRSFPTNSPRRLLLGYWPEAGLAKLLTGCQSTAK